MPPKPLGITTASDIAMKAERFAGQNDARETFLLSIAGVTAIMLIESLILLVLY